MGDQMKKLKVTGLKQDGRVKEALKEALQHRYTIEGELVGEVPTKLNKPIGLTPEDVLNVAGFSVPKFPHPSLYVTTLLCIYTNTLLS